MKSQNESKEKEKQNLELLKKNDEYQKIVNESNQLRISNKKLTDTNCNLKERIESMDKHQTIGLSNLEKEISRVIADNKSFINYFAVIKSELSNTISNALKKENSELKKKMSKIEKEYIEVFKNLKFLENEKFLENAYLNNKFSLFDTSEEFFTKFNTEDFNYLQFKETFALAKSYVHDILKIFLSKQDFFNNNLYDGSLENVKNKERMNDNNIKTCFIK